MAKHGRPFRKIGDPKVVGNKHKGGAGWLGGQHRKEGCLSAALAILGVGATIVGAAGWGAVELVRAVAF